MRQLRSALNYIAGASLICSAALTAQQVPERDRAKLRAEVQRILLADGAPSASIAIVQGGEIVFAEAFGQASLQPSVPATPSTRYQLASVSKTFAAEAILQLESQGKLSLDDTVSRWYPSVSGAGRITLRRLLSHTSGLPDFYPQHYPAGPRGAAATPDSIINNWGSHPLLFEPGTQYRYSNLNYEIAARIVEKVSGEPYFAYLLMHVLRPAGMTYAMDLDTIPDGSKALATGYVREALGPLQAAEYEGPGWSFGSGQVVTTATDVARWDIAFLSSRVLPVAQAREEITPVPLTSGKNAPTALGLFADTQNGRRRVYHTGQGLGFLAMNMIYPDQQLAYVVLVNTSAGIPTLHIADAIEYLWQTPSASDVFARKIFSALQNGTLDASALTPDMGKEWTGARASLYKRNLASLGAVTSFVAHSPVVIDGLETRDYDVTAGGHALKLHLLLLPEGKLEDVVITDAANN